MELLVVIMIGVCAIIGMMLELPLAGIIMLWLLSVGIILIIVGIATVNKSIKAANIQMVTGMLLVFLSAGTLAVFLNILDVYVTLAIIIIIVGITIVALGMSNKR